MSDTIIENDAPADGAEANFLAVIGPSPKIVLSDPKKLEGLYTVMRKELAAFVPDLSTKTSRDKIASHAFKFTRTKTAIEKARKEANAAAQKEIDDRNAVGKEIFATIAGMADQARKPLDDWEAAEEQRENAVKATRTLLAERSLVQAGATVETIEAAIDELEAMTFDPAVFLDELDDIKKARRSACMSLYDAKEAAIKEAEDKAELEKLRLEAAARKAADDAAAEIERRGLATIAAINEVGNGFIGGKPQPYALLLYELQEKIVVDGTLGKYEPMARTALDAAHAKLVLVGASELQASRQREQEAAAQASRDALAEQQRRHDEELAAANARIKAGEDRAREQAAEEQRLAEERERAEKERLANREHVSAVMTAAKLAIMEAAEIDEEAARRVVRAIVAGDVPAVSIEF